MNRSEKERWLPTTKKEVEARGWEWLDVILFAGDAYVDHPSFGVAVVGRLLESLGLRVAIVPQPDWRGDHRDFKKLGTPRLFFGISPGAMDSMINHYTANKRLRSDDAYSPDKQPGMRPDYPSIVYAKILRTLYPDTPIVLGGIESSLRRLTHYDYWQDKLLPGILIDSPADLLIYGMGELPLKALVEQLKQGTPFHEIKEIPQTAYLADSYSPREKDRLLYSHEACLKEKLKQAKNFRTIEEESNKYHASRIIQHAKGRTIVVNPPFPPMHEEELDASFDLPYTRLPHPKYRGKVIPAFEMIKFSVNLHRGCFGGCAFCTISAHQGKFIASRSKKSILKEVKQITEMPDFKGFLSDLGGPSANMYRMKGRNESVCMRCNKPSCIDPIICPNLHADHAPLLEIFEAVDQLPKIKKTFVGSGIRYDLLLHRYRDEQLCQSARGYLEELVTKHVSGRLKVAPEHTEERVLQLMRKPSFKLFGEFKQQFEQLNERQGLNQQLIPYFISSHPGCSEEDMAHLAIKTKKNNFRLEQVQDFTPTPMTLATEIYYTGYHPYTLEKVYTARNKQQKLAQRQFFFWYKPEFRQQITQSLQKMAKNELLKKLFSKESSFNEDNQQKKEKRVIFAHPKYKQTRENDFSTNRPIKSRHPHKKQVKQR